jgi:FkbM family methyltransferase
MTAWRERLRQAVQRFGYTVHRWPANRFHAMQDALILLRRAGYVPRVVIDGGANVGSWTRVAHAIFPEATLHLIEPQPACRRPLEELSQSFAGCVYYPVALVEPGVTTVRLLGGGDGGGGTGARVAAHGERGPDEVECDAATLDALLAARVTKRDRGLLKLDLEGSEVRALRGATGLLERLEVIVTEVHFFDASAHGGPVFADVLGFLGDRGFELYDFAALSPRPRDRRLKMGDVVFVRRDSELLADRGWR